MFFWRLCPYGVCARDNKFLRVLRRCFVGKGRWRRCPIAVSGGYAEARKGKGKGLLGGKEKEMNLPLE